jgi:hypothetical protein
MVAGYQVAGDIMPVTPPEWAERRRWSASVWQHIQL